MKSYSNLAGVSQTRLIVPVLLAGGTGSRLWPLSREQHPKQFLPLIDERSLLQNTALRAAAIDEAVAPIVVGAESHRFLISGQLQEVGLKGATIMLEPESRNTAPAAAAVAHHVAEEYGPDALVFLMAADHVIPDQAAFLRAVESAAEAASQGYIVTFGIKPTRAETGYGYVKTGARLGSTGAYEMESFVEKPNAETAESLISQGGHYWNGGMFLFRAGRFLAELRRLEPEMFALSLEALKQGKRDSQCISLESRSFRRCRSESIDYAVMEKTDLVALVPLDAGWDDVGSWTYLDHLPADDDQHNRKRGDVLTQNSHGNLVHSSSRLVTLVGVDDHIVIETEDAVLVAHKDRAQDVKQMVQTLKASNRSEAVSNKRSYRPWGFYETIALGGRFQVKRICVKPGGQLSLQMHYHRAEHWVVVCGTARVTCGDKSFILSEDKSTYIPLGNVHRLENPGKVMLELIEVQTGVYLGEDDIVRTSDVYGRTEAVAEHACNELSANEM